MLPSVRQEMDIESLEAANQSLQVDLKLAFKRIGDLQAAIEDEMESDDNDDLINRYREVFQTASRGTGAILYIMCIKLLPNGSDHGFLFFSSSLSITTCIFSRCFSQFYSSFLFLNSATPSGPNTDNISLG